MICQSDFAKLPLSGMAIYCLSPFGNTMPHEDIGRLYPLLKMVTGRERIQWHVGIERNENLNVGMIVDDAKKQFLHITPDPSPLACSLEALSVNP
jgi:hypothetical protein